MDDTKPLRFYASGARNHQFLIARLAVAPGGRAPRLNARRLPRGGGGGRCRTFYCGLGTFFVYLGTFFVD